MVPVSPEHITSKVYFGLFGITKGSLRQGATGGGGAQIDASILASKAVSGIREFKFRKRGSHSILCVFFLR
jgi:hypothetical protein